ncbi:MAG: hypothetical protein RQ826_13280, partial [Xanthomonadales bacterium]|nr:hypothetical protein [Xanthomonadales bacterium]
ADLLRYRAMLMTVRDRVEPCALFHSPHQQWPVAQQEFSLPQKTRVFGTRGPVFGTVAGFSPQQVNKG